MAYLIDTNVLARLAMGRTKGSGVGSTLPSNSKWIPLPTPLRALSGFHSRPVCAPQDYKFKVVGRLPRDAWSLTEDDNRLKLRAIAQGTASRGQRQE